MKKIIVCCLIAMTAVSCGSVATAKNAPLEMGVTK